MGWVLSGEPALDAMIVICAVPNGVFTDVLTVRFMGTGFATDRSTVLEGWNWQLAPAGSPEHDIATVPANEPNPETSKETGAVVFPGTTLTLDGTGVPSVKSTMCSVSEKSTVSMFVSEPKA
jgi:hypothetical protein